MAALALLPRTDAAPLEGSARAASWVLQVLAAAILAVTLPFK